MTLHQLTRGNAWGRAPQGMPRENCGDVSHMLPNRDFWEAARLGRLAKLLKLLARPKGFELLTPKFVVWCSIQLSYGRLGWLKRRRRAAEATGPLTAFARAGKTQSRHARARHVDFWAPRPARALALAGAAR